MNVVFLDVDGVINPYENDNGFRYTKTDLVEKLSKKFNTDYSIYHRQDVCMAFIDWSPTAIRRLKRILNETNSKIILSSDWRERNLPRMTFDLFKMYHLEKYWFADNIFVTKCYDFAKRRSEEIKASLNKYPIDNYVVLDDCDELLEYFPDNMVVTDSYIKDDDVEKAIKILKRNI